MKRASRSPVPPSRAGEIWVLGGGRFGRQAARSLAAAPGGAAVVIVDRIELRPPGPGIDCVRAEAIDWLAERLSGDRAVRAIIPALPLHVGLEWLKREMARSGWRWTGVELSDALLERFPHPLRTGPGQAVVSHAEFTCPPHCPEPEDRCSHTGLPRPEPLHRLLARKALPGWLPLILTSRQFGPGIGGFFPDDLIALYQSATARGNMKLLVATACKCHGIIDGIRFVRDGKG